MSDTDRVYQALARGFRYPPRPGDESGDSYDDADDADPYDAEVPRAPLSLEPAQTASLVRAIDVHLAAHGCDNTLRAAHAWARRVKIRWAWLRNVLEARGGFCDCEVMFNVVPPPAE